MSQDDHQEVFRSVAQAGREAVCALWRRRGEAASLEPAEKRLVKLLEEHDEYRDFWEGTKEADENENPFMHLTFHQLLNQQLEADDPPGTCAALERLVAQGLDAHKAKHEIIKVLVFDLHNMMMTQREFDAEAYRKKLDALGTDEPT